MCIIIFEHMEVVTCCDLTKCSGTDPVSAGKLDVRCLWCFTLLMKLYDFVTDPAYSVPIFRDAHTDALLPEHTADLLDVLHMCFHCAHKASTVRYASHTM